MNTLYRIYTEDVNRAWIVAYVGAAFQSFTLIPASGVWQYIIEQSLIIEIIGTAEDAIAVRGTAQGIKAHNKQDAVLITKSNIEGILF